jgi:hypothetical protein
MRMRLGLVCLLFAGWTQTSFAQTEACLCSADQGGNGCFGGGRRIEITKSNAAHCASEKQTTNKQTISVGAEIVI